MNMKKFSPNTSGADENHDDTFGDESAWQSRSPRRGGSVQHEAERSDGSGLIKRSLKPSVSVSETDAHGTEGGGEGDFCSNAIRAKERNTVHDLQRRYSLSDTSSCYSETDNFDKTKSLKFYKAQDEDDDEGDADLSMLLSSVELSRSTKITVTADTGESAKGKTQQQCHAEV